MIKKGIIYFVVITALLYGSRELHYWGLLKQTSGYCAKYRTAFFEKNDFDVLFLGSSRVEMHYSTKIFDSICHKNSFNLSLAGATPQVAFAALKAYAVNSKMPQQLFYEIDYHFVKYKSTEVKEFNNYFPYLSNDVLRSEFNKIDSRMDHFYYNPYFSFPYTGFKNLSTSMHGWLNIPNKTDSLYYKGHIKEVFRPHLNYNPVTPYYTYFNVSDRNYLDSIIQFCKSHKTTITLVSSPIFGGGKVDLVNKKAIIQQLQDISKINGISYFDLSSLDFCNDRKLFIDHYHMNYSGSSKFTIYFSHFFNNKTHLNSLK